jgi:acetyl-CoA acetyltransferase
MKPVNQMREVLVAGVGTTKWGVFPEKKWYDLGSEAIHKALGDAGLEWRDIQAVFSGSVYQGTGSGHQAVREVGLTGIPIVNVENACSSGSSAFRLAYQVVAADLYDVVLALGMEKMPQGPIASTAFRPIELQMGFNVQFANYAMEALEYMAEYGATEEDFSMVTVKNRQNGTLNPNGRFQKAVTLEEVMSSRMVAKPLRLLHCCPLADGAAAAVLCCKQKVKSKTRSVTVASSTLSSGVYGEAMYPCAIVESVKYGGSAGIIEVSAREAYECAAIGPEDIDLVQAYDTMAPAELWDIEKLGLCPHGEAPRMLREQVFHINGKMPVNTDGGLMSRGHPLGATGLGQILEVVTQLRGEAGARQVKAATVGLCHAMGAGPNSAVTILKR